MALTGYQPRFLRQPSGPVRINEKHWLARDLVFAHTGLQAFAYGRPIAPTIEVAPSVQFATAAADGNGAIQHTVWPTATGSVYERYAIGALAGQPLTLMAWNRSTNHGAETPALCLRAGATTEAVELSSSATELTVARSRTSANASNAATATGTVVSGAWQHGAAVFINSASRKSYFNGGGEASSATSRVVNSVLDTVEILRSGNDTVGASTLGGVALPIILSRALTLAEIEQFYREQLSEPWALFVPRRVFVPVASAGGAPSADLAAAGASGAFSGDANSAATAALAATGAAGAFAGAASSPATVEMAVAGAAGAFSGAAQSPATASMAAAGSSGDFAGGATSGSSIVDAAIAGGGGIFVGLAFSEATVAAAIDGASGSFSGSAGDAVAAPAWQWDMMSGRMMYVQALT